MVLYAGMCSSLIRLRELRPNADAFRIPFGPGLSMLGVAISLALTAGLKGREVYLMCFTALIATTNWLWAKRRHRQSEQKVEAAARAFIVWWITAKRRMVAKLKAITLSLAFVKPDGLGVRVQCDLAGGVPQQFLHYLDVRSGCA